MVAANKEQKRLLAIECKAVGDNAKYFEPEDIEQLAQFAAFMGAEPWFAMRFNREDWFFVHLNDVKANRRRLICHFKGICKGKRKKIF